MYSPKIEDELISRIYQIAKARGMKMTTLVNEILRKALNSIDAIEDQQEKKEVKI